MLGQRLRPISLACKLLHTTVTCKWITPTICQSGTCLETGMNNACMHGATTPTTLIQPCFLSLWSLSLSIWLADWPVTIYSNEHPYAFARLLQIHSRSVFLLFQVTMKSIDLIIFLLPLPYLILLDICILGLQSLVAFNTLVFTANFATFTAFIHDRHVWYRVS